MKLVIEDGVLRSCVLAKSEHTVRLPETVRKIGNYAFAGNAEGQIRHLTLPDSLEYIAPRAFSGLERLSSLTAFTCGWDRSECRAVDEDDTGNDLIAKVDTLILLNGKGGNFFAWGYLMVEEPRCLIMANNMNVGCWFEYQGKWRDGYISSIEELIVWIAPSAVPESEAYFDGRLIADMRGSLKKLRIVTDIHLSFMLEKTRSWAACLNRIRSEPACSESGRFIPRITMDFGFIHSLDALEELVLPEGLRDIGAGAFRGCRSLKKALIPSTVANIENNAFRDCGSLRQVSFCSGRTVAAGPGAFYGCNRLKSFSLYTEGYIRSDQETVHTADAGAFLAQGRILYFFNKVEKYIYTLSLTDSSRAYDEELYRFTDHVENEIKRLKEYGCTDTSLSEWFSRIRGALFYGWDLMKARLERNPSEKISEGLLNSLEAGVKAMEEYILSQEAELLYADRPVSAFHA